MTPLIATTTARSPIHRLWLAFAAMNALFILLYFTVLSYAGGMWGYPFVSLAAAGAICAGIVLHRPPARLAWATLASGLVLICAGDLLWTYFVLVLRIEPFPSASDAIYIGGFLLLITGGVLLVREYSPGYDRGVVIDALIVALGAGILTWCLIMAPYATDDSSSRLARAVALAYPLGDLFLLLVLVRLVFAGGVVSRAMLLLTTGVALYLVADAWYFYLEFAGTYRDGHPVDAGWMAGFACFGLAALHPSIARRAPARALSRSGLSRRRLAMLTAATMLSPAALVFQWELDEPDSIPVIAAGSAVLFLLVLARLNGYLAEHRRAEARERALRDIGSRLGAATGPDAVLRTTLEGARRLAAGARADVRLLTGPLDALNPIDEGGHVPFDLAATAPAAAEALRGGGPVLLGADDAPLRAGLSAAHDASGILLPLLAEGEVAGVLVGVGSPFPLHLANALTGLVGQAALALDNARLAQDVQRRRSEAHFRALVQNAADVIAIATPDGRVSYVSPAIRPLSGHDPDRLTGDAFWEIVHPDDRAPLREALANATSVPPEVRLRAAGGGWRICAARASDLTGDPDIAGVVLTLHDVTEQKGLEQQLFHQAFHDPLTGLPNRALFLDRLTQALARANRAAEPLAVIFIDVDDFKLVNDSLGHAAGDELLKGIATRLYGATRPGDTVARLGGDEFTVLLEGADPAAAAAFAERVQQVMAQPIRAGERAVTVTLSIGLAAKTGPETTADDLMRHADVAMYVAKERGKANHAAFDPGMADEVWTRLAVEAELRQAIDRGEFVVHYQPIMELADERIAEVEALVRWHHPARGLLPPAAFMPAAERTGLLARIGWGVLAEACRQAVAWGPPSTRGGVTMNVNLAPAMLREPDVAERIGAVLTETGLPPHRLKLEIGEAALMADGDATIATLQRLKALGVQLAIDDFGTGYSSLAALRRFPVDVIKIDRSFVAELEESPEDLAIVESIVGLARALSLEVTSEGVETGAQLERVRRLGSHRAQGYLVSRPLPAEELGALLATGGTPALLPTAAD